MIQFFKKNKSRAAAELVIANKEKDKRAAELVLADTILEAMIDGVVVIDTKGNITKCNIAYAKMTGVKTREETIGINLSGLIAERDVQRTMTDVKKCFETGSTVNFEHIAKDKTGKEFPVLVNASAMKDEKGKVIGVIRVVRDITDRKKAEEDLQSKIIELERFNKITMGRELRILELKEEVARLKAIKQ